MKSATVTLPNGTKQEYVYNNGKLTPVNEDFKDKNGNKVNVTVKNGNNQPTDFANGNLSKEKLQKTIDELQTYIGKGYSNLEVQTNAKGEITGATVKTSDGKTLAFKQDHGILVYDGDKDLYARECYDEYMLYRQGGDSGNIESGRGEFRIGHKDGKLMNWDPTGADNWETAKNSYHFVKFSINGNENLNQNLESISKLPDLLNQMDGFLKGECTKGASNRQVDITTDKNGNVTGAVIKDKAGNVVAEMEYKNGKLTAKSNPLTDRSADKQKLDADMKKYTDSLAQSALKSGSHGCQGSVVYDAKGNKVQITASGNVTSNGLEQFVKYSYTDKTTKDPSDALFEQISYDKNGRVKSKITYRRDGQQQTTTYTYDSKGNATETKSALTAAKTGDFKEVSSNCKISYENGTYKTTYTNSLGGKETYVYDSNGRETLHTQDYPSNTTIDDTKTVTTYKADGSSVRDQFHMDQKGNVLSEWIETSDASGKWTNITKKENGTTVSVDYTSVPFGKQNQNVASEVMKTGNFAKGSNVEVKLDSNGKISTVKAKDANGKTVEYEAKYDSKGNYTLSVKSERTEEKQKMDADANKILSEQAKKSLQNPNTSVGTGIYDSKGNLVNLNMTAKKTSTGLDQSVKYTYTDKTAKDGSDPMFEEVKYDNNGKMLSKTTYRRDGKVQETKYTYDANGKVTETKSEPKAITNGKSNYLNENNLTYKDGHYVAEHKDSLGDTHTTTYDENGREVKYVYARKEYTMTSNTTYAADGSKTLTRTYTDKNGKITSKNVEVSDNKGFKSVTTEKDGVTVTINRPANGKSLGQSDATKLLESFDFPKGSKVVAEPDANGKITSMKVTDSNGKTTEIKVTYRADGTKSETKELDSKGNLLKDVHFYSDGRIYYQDMYEYDANGKKISHTSETVNGGGTGNYKELFDSNGKVTMTIKDWNMDHKTDYVVMEDKNNISNMPKKLEEAAGQKIKIELYDKNATGNKYSVIGYAEYDKNGNLTKVTDANGKEIKQGTQQTNNDKEKITYNADGTIKTKVTEENGIIKTTNYTYNSDGSVTQKTTQAKRTGDNSFMASSSDPISELTTYKNGKTVEKIYSMDGSLAPKTITKEGNKTTTVETQPTNLMNNSSYTKTTIEINGVKTQETYKKSFFLPGNAREDGYTINYANGVETNKTEYHTQGDGYGNSTTTTTKSYKGVVNERDVEVKNKDGSSKKTETHLYSDGRVYYEDTTEYDKNGKKISKNHEVVNGGGTGSYKELYDDKGNVTMTIKDYNMDKTPDEIVITDTAQLKNIPAALLKNGSIKVVLYNKDAVGNKYTDLGVVKYDAKGRITSQVNADGGRTEFKYRDDGSKTESKDYDKNGNMLKEVHYYADGRVYYQESYTYDSKNQKTSHKHEVVNGGGTYNYTEYFTNGKLSSKTTVYPSGKTFMEEKFNTNGKPTEQKYFNQDGTPMKTTKYTYDSNGKEKMQRTYDAKGKEIANKETSGDTVIDRSFKYNADGTLNSWIQKIFNKGIQKRELTYDRKTGTVITYEVIQKTDAQGHIYYEKKEISRSK